MAMDPNSNSVYTPKLTPPNPLPAQGGAGMGESGEIPVPTPMPLTKYLTFGHKVADFSALTNDIFPNVYLMWDTPADITDLGVFFRAFSGDVLSKLSVAVGDVEAGTVTVGLYSAATIQGDYTLVHQENIAVTPTGTNILVEKTVNVALTAGSYYFLTVTSATANVVQLAFDGGLHRYTGSDPLPASLTGAGTTSNYAVVLYGTVTRTVNP